MVQLQQNQAAMAPSPTTPAGVPASTMAAVDPVPEVLRQLPDPVRQVLHGCVSSGNGATERGSNIIVYVTSADSSGEILTKSISSSPSTA